MKKIDIDNEVFLFLQKKAIPFVDTPNLTLRRLLGLDEKNEKVKIKNEIKPSELKKKGQKTSLDKLIRCGLLKEGQVLFLYDYQKKRIPGFDVPIIEDHLRWEGKLYSMSKLAEILLKQNGYNSNSVRGPAHWFTEDRNSIQKLWEYYLEKTK